MQVTSEGQTVRLVTADVPTNCDRIGRVQAQTQLIGIERGAERLQEELAQIARNEALTPAEILSSQNPKSQMVGRPSELSMSLTC